jgi:hypothetical protein
VKFFNFVYVRRLVLTILGVLIFCSVVYAAGVSNKWRIQVSEGAKSTGVISFLISPKGEESILVVVNIPDGTWENHVARIIRDTMKEKLPRKHFHVEVDDGEDVLIKKRHRQSNFGLELVDNTVKSVRISLDKE